MRLIDADALIKNILQEAAHQAVIGHPENARGLIYAADYMKEQPTAYDVDKVVEQLEDAIEIVKGNAKYECPIPEGYSFEVGV